MAKDIYRELQECIDQYSVGFGATESGVELKILKKLFTEEEVRMYMDLTLELESAEEVAARTNQDPAKVEGVLQGMMKKGLVFPRYPKKEGEPFYYAAAPFAHGIFEHQLKRMDKELAELFEEYFESGAMATKEVLPMRTVPVSTAIVDAKIGGSLRQCQGDHQGQGPDQPVRLCLRRAASRGRTCVRSAYRSVHGFRFLRRLLRSVRHGAVDHPRGGPEKAGRIRGGGPDRPVLEQRESRGPVQLLRGMLWRPSVAQADRPSLDCWPPATTTPS